MMIAAKATIRTRRPRLFGPSPNGTHVCDVLCPACKRSMTLTYGGWTAIACRCGLDLYRPVSWAAKRRKQ